MQRLIELFIDTNTMEFYNRDGALGASTPSISAGELVQLNVQLCDGAPDFDESGAVTNPDTRFAGTLAAGEFVVDNNYNWYDPVTIMDAVTAGSAIETLEIQSTTTPRTLGTIIIAGTDYVNYCEAVKTETGYLLTLADAEFSPAAFTPSVNCDAGSAARNLERPVIVSAQNDSTGRATGLFTGLLDAANPVYESMIEGNPEISGTILEVNIYDEGRSVFRARFDFDCLGAIAASSSAGYIKSNVWTEADSRYIRLSDWTQPDEYQFSADGSTEWHDTQTDDDVYIRIRRPGGEWGQAIKLPSGPQGPQGEPGEQGPRGPAGADGEPGPANVLTIGTVTTGEPGTQAAASITGESPNQVLNLTIPRGDKGESGTGSGSGDMLKSEYDTDNDGKVDAAEEADDALNIGGKTAAQVATAVDNSHTHSNKSTLDKLGESGGKLTFDGAEVGGGGTADSVAWDDVTGKPSTFPPASHNHEISDVNGLQSALDAKGTVKSVNGVEPDSSGNVTIETGSSVDESRLLPETPEDGDVPVFNATSTAGGGNNETVKLLIQPSTSENQIVDSAAGNVVPVSLSIEGDITVSEEGIMQFTQSQTISVPMAFSTVEMITGNSEWCLDFEFIPPTDLNDDNEFWSLYNDEQSYVGFWRGSMGDIVHMPCFGDIPGFTRGEKHLLTFEQWKDGETWKLSGYRNGSIGKTVETLIPATTSQDISFGHGNKRKFRGQIVSIRFRNVAPYRGTSFQPDATPYTVPQVVGAWENQNLNEQIDAKIATHNTSLDAHPMQGATTNDYNGLDTNCSWYLSYGDNTSNVNAPANGPFFVMTKKWTNSSGTNGAGMQIAIRNMTGNLVNQAVYVRTWSMSSGWRTWQKVGSSAMAGTPDYGAGVNIVSSATSDSGYTCTSAGWIMCYIMQSGVTVTINGNTIDKMSSIRALLPVASGDIFKASVETTWTSGEITFYPNR